MNYLEIQSVIKNYKDYIYIYIYRYEYIYIYICCAKHSPTALNI